MSARCKCSHSVSLHTRREGWCNSSVCGCKSFRDDGLDAAIARHPAGKAIPSPESIDRSVQ